MSGPRPTRRNVDGLSEGCPGGLHQRFTERRMRMDRPGHVLRDGRHFDRQHPLGDQLARAGTDDPHAQHSLGLGIPFLASKSMWQSGIGGSIPSMIAYVLSAVGVFRVVRDTLSTQAEPDYAARTAGWIAAACGGTYDGVGWTALRVCDAIGRGGSTEGFGR